MERIERIDGLSYYDNVISGELENELMQYLNAAKWKHVSGAGSREVIQLGYDYDYRSQKVTKGDDIPDVIEKLKSLIPDGEKYNQCIINKYLPGQGISAHIDSKNFGDTIVCFTIGSTATMVFSSFKSTDLKLTKEINEKYSIPILVKPNSVYIMTGPARYQWTHEMTTNKTDKIDGKITKRKTRISLTFRTV
jgi:alkylated DNA repair dioxygenase AlkB